MGMIHSERCKKCKIELYPKDVVGCLQNWEYRRWFIFGYMPKLVTTHLKYRCPKCFETIIVKVKKYKKVEK